MPVGTGRAYPDSSSAKIALCFTCRRCDLIFASTPIDLNVFAEHKVGNRAHTRLCCMGSLLRNELVLPGILRDCASVSNEVVT